MKKIPIGLLFLSVMTGNTPALGGSIDFCSLIEDNLVIRGLSLKVKVPREFRCGLVASRTLADIETPYDVRRGIEFKELKPFVGLEFAGKDLNLSLEIGRGAQLNLGARW